MDQDDDRGDEMFAERLTGASTRAVAKRYHVSTGEVEAAIDCRLDYELDNARRLKMVKLDLARLDALMAPFFERAVKDKDVAAGTLCCKLLERRALLCGLDSPTRVDIVQLQAQERPSQFEMIREAIFAVARGQPGDGDGAGGLLSGSDAKER